MWKLFFPNSRWTFFPPFSCSIKGLFSSLKMIFWSFIRRLNRPRWRPLARREDIRPHSSRSIKKAVCAQDWLHDQSRAGAAKMTSAPTHLPPPPPHCSSQSSGKNAPLACCLWEEFGSRDGWMEEHRGFWADNGSNSSWARCMQVQMQVTHRTSPRFQATKETGRDLSGQHFGLWRQHDQMTPSRT